MLNGIAIGLIIGLIPTIIGFILPRKKTIKYGMFVYKFIGKFLVQHGSKVTKRSKKLTKAVAALQTTFSDFAFGIYLASETNNKLEIKQEIEDRLV